MRSRLFFTTILFLLVYLTSFGQKLISSTLDIELPSGSTLETRSEKIKKCNAALENFASSKKIKLFKGKAEIFHTDFEALKTLLIEKNFEITQEENPDFYRITKGSDKFLAYIKQDATASHKLEQSSSLLQLSMITSRVSLFFGVTTTMTIKRCY